MQDLPTAGELLVETREAVPGTGVVSIVPALHLAGCVSFAMLATLPAWMERFLHSAARAAL